MKKLVVLFVAVLASAGAYATDSHPVRGHTDKNGTYVPPHRQTNPNDTETDNWSSKGNVNPDTGKEGTKTPKK